jgi:hypothetical protein
MKFIIRMIARTIKKAFDEVDDEREMVAEEKRKLEYEKMRLRRQQKKLEGYLNSGSKLGYEEYRHECHTQFDV